MKLLKFALVGLIAFGGLNTFAQEEGTAEKASQKIEKLSEELNLTEEQKEQAKEISLRYQEKKHAIKADSTLSVEDRQAQLKELRISQKEEIEGILNEEQAAKFEEIVAKKKEERQKRTPEEIADAQTKRMTEALDLTDEQVEKVRDLNLKVANKIAVIKNDDSMSPEKKKEFIRGNREDHKRVMKTILTDEQFIKYEEQLENRKAKFQENKEGKQIETATE